MRRPNIVFFFSDQQRYDTLGCNGQKLDVTPNLDRLAKEGVCFDNAYTPQPVCGPARACLQSGRYPTEIGCFVNSRPLDFSAKNLADYFSESGYKTAYVGKWHLASDLSKGLDYTVSAIPEDRRGGYKDYWMASDLLEFTSHGYDGYVFDINNRRVDFCGYRADCITDFAIDFIKNTDTDRPFFLFVSHIEPHHQNDHKHYEGPEGSKEKFKNFERPGDLNYGQGDWETEYPDYLGCCNSLDSNLGRIIETLKEKGIYDNTYIVYTSDHGSHFRTRNSEYKRSCHDGCIHIPLVVSGPDVSKNIRCDDLVSLIDLPPTLLDMAGIEIPEKFRGKTILPLLHGENDDSRTEVFLQISESQVGRAIRTKKYKYSVRADADGWRNSKSDTYYEDYFYDLESDPFEQNNLVNDSSYKAVRAELAERLKMRMKEAGEEIPQILPYEMKPLGMIKEK